MLTDTQNDLYFSRMKHSVGDKKRMLDYLTGGANLDFGAGGGELAEIIRRMGIDSFASDGSTESVNRMQTHFPQVFTFLASSSNITEKISGWKFDSITASSVFHEVFSYGGTLNDGTESGVCSLEHLTETIDKLSTLLKPKGRLIIRDGVKPKNWDEQVVVHIDDEQVADILETYANIAPFWQMNGSERTVWMKTLPDRKTFTGNLSSVMEFLYTYTWGVESLERESQELYGVLTIDEWSTLLTTHGYEIITTESYLQKGYVDNLLNVHIFDSTGEKVSLPDSNMILVAQKKK